MSDCQTCEYCDLVKNKCILSNIDCYSKEGCLHTNCNLYQEGTWQAGNGYEEFVSKVETIGKIKLPTKVKVTNPVLEKYFNKIFNISSIHIRKRKVTIGFSFSSTNYGNVTMDFEDIEFVEFEEV